MSVTPWAASLGQWFWVLTRLTVRLWSAADFFWDADELATGIGEHPCVWTDGSREAYCTGSFEVAGVGVYLPAPELAIQGAVWEEVEEYGDVRLDRCRAFMRVPGPLQTFQPA